MNTKGIQQFILGMLMIASITAVIILIAFPAPTKARTVQSAQPIAPAYITLSWDDPEALESIFIGDDELRDDVRVFHKIETTLPPEGSSVVFQFRGKGG